MLFAAATLIRIATLVSLTSLTFLFLLTYRHDTASISGIIADIILREAIWSGPNGAVIITLRYTTFYF